MSNRHRETDVLPCNLENFKTIQRPRTSKSNGQQKEASKDSGKVRTFQIEKSFVPDSRSQLNKAIAPQLKVLKDFYKKKIAHEKKIKQLLEEGKIKKEDLEGRKEKSEDVKAQKVQIDDAGQLRDQKGNLMFVKNRASDLSINKRIEEGTKIKELGKKQKIKYHENLSRKLRDGNLALMSGNKRRIKRSRLGLQFMEKGSYQSVSVLQDQVKKEVENLSDALQNNREQYQARSRVIKKRSRTKLQHNHEIPEIEWWDKGVLNADSYCEILKDLNIPQQQCIDLKAFEGKQVDRYLNIDRITDEVRFQKVGNQDIIEENVVMPMFLTKAQRKKLKRKRKKEKLLEKNDMIKLGLIEPEKPKLRVANMAVVMKNEFIVDPSKIEEIAKREEQERLDKHLTSNSARKLTPKQRQEKHIRKLKRDSAKECRRVIFKLGKLTSSSQIFKVNMNAKQLALNGFVIKPSDYHRQVVMVAAEGGAKAIKFYKNLMLNRIKWEEEEEQMVDEGDKKQLSANKCVLVWEGIVENTTLGKWKVHEVNDESQTIKILKEKGVEFFWDYVVN